VFVFLLRNRKKNTAKDTQRMMILYRIRDTYINGTRKSNFEWLRGEMLKKQSRHSGRRSLVYPLEGGPMDCQACTRDEKKKRMTANAAISARLGDPFSA